MLWTAFFTDSNGLGLCGEGVGMKTLYKRQDLCGCLVFMNEKVTQSACHWWRYLQPMIDWKKCPNAGWFLCWKRFFFKPPILALTTWIGYYRYSLFPENECTCTRIVLCYLVISTYLFVGTLLYWFLVLLSGKGRDRRVQEIIQISCFRIRSQHLAIPQGLEGTEDYPNKLFKNPFSAPRYPTA